MVGKPWIGVHGSMGFVWGLIKALSLFFAVVIAVLVVIDGSLLSNLFNKSES